SILSYSKKDGLLVTGGMDRLIRLWNTRFSEKPDGILKGHSAPIFSLCISSEDSQIFSVSTDNTVKVIHCCLFTADPTASGIHGDVTACSFSPAMRALYVAADCIAVLPLMSRLFVVVKVWDLESGRQVFEFTATPDLTDITCMTLDFKGRRLVTGGSNGCLKLWNFNSGQCLKTLKKGKCHEVCDCSFLRVNENFYVVAVGRNQRIDIYLDVPEELHGIQRPEPSWKDDLKNGHKEDILCVVQCPPSFLVTGSKNGEIIVWNTASGSIQCRFLGPPGAKDLNTEGDIRISCLQFHYIFFFCTWFSLQIVTSDRMVLTSSTDQTVRLWSSQGEFIGTFGQPEMWSVQIPSSWIHPGVPDEVLIDPLTMPNHDILKRESHLSEAINSDVTETDKGELKVSCNISKMITRALPLSDSFYCHAEPMIL
uniref:WD40 repeat domain 95 n=1 Tax=Cyprinodon variegatus TaxID=28743 RepID=A0A3Q2CWZ6_CYPVA